MAFSLNLDFSIPPTAAANQLAESFAKVNIKELTTFEFGQTPPEVVFNASGPVATAAPSSPSVANHRRPVAASGHAGKIIRKNKPKAAFVRGSNSTVSLPLAKDDARLAGDNELYKRKTVIQPTAAQPQPPLCDLPVELLDHALGYLSLHDHHRAAAAIKDINRRNRLALAIILFDRSPNDSAKQNTANKRVKRMHLMSSDETIRTLVDVKAIDVASEMGDLDLLNTLIEMGTPDDIDMMYTKRAVDLALERNDSHDILRWWLKNGLRIDCTWSMAQILSGNGAYFYFFPNTRVLELVKAKEEQSPGSLDWTTWLCSAMDTASVHGQVDALEWLKNSGWPITWTDKSMDATRSVNVLAWWVQSGLELKYTENLLNSASANGHIDILEFWRTKSGFFPLYTERAMDTADNAAVLAWWKKAAEESSWELRYTDRAVGNASDCFYSEGDKYLVSPSLPILRWWAASGLPLKLPNNLSPDLVRNREVKQWWTLRRRWLDANDSP